MKVQQNRTVFRHPWLKKPIRAQPLQSWLIDSGSLTSRLKRQYPDFFVHPLGLKNAKALLGESTLLGLKASQYAINREVFLMGNFQPLVFAHSVMPKKSLRGSWSRLGKLGNKPLGAALFANPRVVRAPLCFKKLSPHQALYQKATKHLTGKPAYLWARRSVFNLNGAKILVTEVFLPQIYDY